MVSKPKNFQTFVLSVSRQRFNLHCQSFRCQISHMDPSIQMPFSIKMCGFWISPITKLQPTVMQEASFRPKDPLMHSHIDQNKDAPGSPSCRPSIMGGQMETPP